MTSIYCYKNWRLVIFQGSINVATDLYILCLPIVVIVQLQLTLMERIRPVTIFVIGSLEAHYFDVSNKGISI